MKKYIIITLFAGLLIGLTYASESLVPQTADVYQKDCVQEIEAATALFKKIEAQQDSTTVETVLIPLNELSILLYNSASKASLFYHVHPDQQVRDIAEKQQQDLTTLITEISLSRSIYEACQSIDAAETDTLTQRAINHTLRDYRRSGVAASEETRKRIRILNDELTQLSQQFSLNISSDVRSIKLDSTEELAGLPEDYIAAHPPGDDGKITITTDYPDYLPFSRFAKNDDRRRELYIAFKNRGYPKNEQVLKDILKKRYEYATLLDYKNYAEYTAETKMIGNAADIRTFIDKISTIAQPRADREYATLLERLRKIEPNAEEVGDWQKTYLEELIKQEHYQVDAKEVRKYFQFGSVRDGILALTSKMYGVTFRKWETDVWDENVLSYEMLDEDKVIGRFYLDLHPRENKYKHAAHFDLLAGVTGRQLPTSALICNFPGKGDETALMEHSQVETFLHEFGHLLHHLFAGEQQWIQFSGIATEHDFVEAPSQMLEEWVWSAEVLKDIAINAEGEHLPTELLEKMVAAKEFGSGLFVTHQMFYAAMSLNYYDCDPELLNLRRKMAELQFRYSPFDFVPDTHMYASFGHLYGYSAAYYTYMWSLVISKDLFSRFEETSLFDRSVAEQYRNTILAPGGSKDAAQLVTDFLGRPYSFEPFAKWLNEQPEQ